MIESEDGRKFKMMQWAIWSGGDPERIAGHDRTAIRSAGRLRPAVIIDGKDRIWTSPGALSRATGVPAVVIGALLKHVSDNPEWAKASAAHGRDGLNAAKGPRERYNRLDARFRADPVAAHVFEADVNNWFPWVPNH